MKKYLIKDIISGCFVRLEGNDAEPTLVYKPATPWEFAKLAHFNSIEAAEKNVKKLLTNNKSVVLTIIEVYI